MSVMEDIARDLPEVKQENRLPYMTDDELAAVMDKYGFTYFAVWRCLGRSKHPCQRVDDKPVEVLTLDAGASKGAFAKAMDGWEITKQGGSVKGDDTLLGGEALPWNCFKSENGLMVEYYEDLATSKDPRKQVAKESGIRGAFAMFRDGAVYELGGETVMQELPNELIYSIGGSTGVNAAAKTVHAVVKLKKLGKSKGA